MFENDYHKDIAVSIAANLRNIRALMPTFEKFAALDQSDHDRIKEMINSFDKVELIIEQKINQYYKDQSSARHYNPQK